VEESNVDNPGQETRGWQLNKLFPIRAGVIAYKLGDSVSLENATSEPYLIAMSM